MDIKKILEKFRQKKILVIGDLMYDIYLWGTVGRISPEAPVPVVDLKEIVTRFGGAANVAMNLFELYAEVSLTGVVGQDDAGSKLIKELHESGFETGGVIVEGKRTTTTKTRIGTNNQQIVRVDNETTRPINSYTGKFLVKFLEEEIPKCQAIVFEDYNKGLLTRSLIRKVIEIARKHSLIIAVDPKHLNFASYTGVTVFKPNMAELCAYLKCDKNNRAKVLSMARAFRKKIECEHMVVTNGSEGMIIITGKDEIITIPAAAQEVFDVSGAGDTVISTITLSLCAGLNIVEACELASIAAGIVCGKHGTASVCPEELLALEAGKR